MEDKDFAEAMQRMIKDNGKDVLLAGKAKAYIRDYKGQFNTEADIFLKLLEADCGKIINEADNVLERKRQLVERMEDKHGISPKHAMPLLDLLGFLLKGDTSKIGNGDRGLQSKHVDQTQRLQTTNPLPTAAPQAAQTKAAVSAAKTEEGPLISPLGYEMVRVAGGSFQMGDTVGGGENDERPVHTVTLSAFYIGKYVVTQDFYQKITGDNPSENKGCKFPVVLVSWYGAVEFCNILSVKEGLSPYYNINKTITSDPNSKSVYNTPIPCKSNERKSRHGILYKM